MGAAEGQFDEQAYPFPDGEQWGIVADGHTFPQLPQLAGWVMSVSQPSSALLVQCPHPTWHDVGGTEHLPMTHVAGPPTCARAVQSWPQAPQFFGSLSLFVHAVPQESGVEEGHEHPPPPAMQLWPFAHALHAAPALPHSLSVCVVVTHPVASQQPPAHDVASHATQAPPAQIWLVPLAPQGFPSLMLLGEPHTGPAEQDIVPRWHGFPVGVQDEFALHWTHVPCVSHTPLATVAVWQDVPAAAGVFWSVQVRLPLLHAVILPTWQGLPAGSQELPTWHALHCP
jgi:hypothetical protein